MSEKKIESLFLNILSDETEKKIIREIINNKDPHEIIESFLKGGSND